MNRRTFEATLEQREKLLRETHDYERNSADYVFGFDNGLTVTVSSRYSRESKEFFWSMMLERTSTLELVKPNQIVGLLDENGNEFPDWCVILRVDYDRVAEVLDFLSKAQY